MRLRGALGEAAYESRRHALLEELVRSAAAPSGALESAAAVLDALHGLGFLDRGHVSERAELTLWVDQLLGTHKALAARQPLAAGCEGRASSPPPSVASTPKTAASSSPHQSAWRRATSRIVLLGSMSSPVRSSRKASSARGDLL